MEDRTAEEGWGSHGDQQDVAIEVDSPVFIQSWEDNHSEKREKADSKHHKESIAIGWVYVCVCQCECEWASMVCMTGVCEQVNLWSWVGVSVVVSVCVDCVCVCECVFVRHCA